MNLVKELRIKSVLFEGPNMKVSFSDGQTLALPLEQFPRLRAATDAQRHGWSLIGRGIGVHWEELDEDLSVENLLTAHSRRRHPTPVPVSS
jgi:hypothetical protein